MHATQNRAMLQINSFVTTTATFLLLNTSNVMQKYVCYHEMTGQCLKLAEAHPQDVSGCPGLPRFFGFLTLANGEHLPTSLKKNAFFILLKSQLFSVA